MKENQTCLHTIPLFFLDDRKCFDEGIIYHWNHINTLSLCWLGYVLGWCRNDGWLTGSSLLYTKNESEC